MADFRRLRDGGGVFHDEPEDFAIELEFNALRHIADGLPGLTQRMLPHLEEEAISRLRHAGARLVVQDEKHLKDLDWDWWRLRWVEEARYFLRHSEQGPINATIAYSAAEALTRASDLRYAIEDGHAEKAAALAMLVASWVFMGGVSLRLLSAEPTAKKFRFGQKRKAQMERTTLETDDGGTTKRGLVALAWGEAGKEAGTPEVWNHLLGVLDVKGFSPQETGAKSERKIAATDASGKAIHFTFKGVQTMLGRLKEEKGQKTKTGRPRKKPH